MTSNQLVQMALSAIIRCNEKVDLFELVDILCGKQTSAVKRHGYDTIKTFGAGNMFTRRQWHYWLIQMIEQGILIIDYDDHVYLKVLEKGHKVLKGELDITLKRASSKSSKITRKESFKITRKGVPLNIDIDIQDSIDWRKKLDELNKTVYWNYASEQRININEIIPIDIAERERVKAKFLEIASQVYNLAIENGDIIIPKKVDYDMYGKEVLPLSLPFEECLSRLEHFIKTTGRYPQMNSVSEEVALRKWYREVGHGLIEITPEQKELFRRFTEQYPMSQKTTKAR